MKKIISSVAEKMNWQTSRSANATPVRTTTNHHDTYERQSAVGQRSTRARASVMFAAPDQVVGVGQGQWARVHKDGKRHIVASAGAGTCVNVGVYFPHAQCAVLGHVDAAADVSAFLQDVQYQTGCAVDATVDVHLASRSLATASRSLATTQATVTNVREALRKQGLSTWNEYDSDALAIDAAHGRVHVDFPSAQVAVDSAVGFERMMAVMAMTGTHMPMTYVHVE